MHSSHNCLRYAFWIILQTLTWDFKCRKVVFFLLLVNIFCCENHILALQGLFHKHKDCLWAPLRNLLCSAKQHSLECDRECCRSKPANVARTMEFTSCNTYTAEKYYVFWDPRKLWKNYLKTTHLSVFSITTLKNIDTQQQTSIDLSIFGIIFLITSYLPRCKRCGKSRGREKNYLLTLLI